MYTFLQNEENRMYGFFFKGFEVDRLCKVVQSFLHTLHTYRNILSINLVRFSIALEKRQTGSST